MANKVPVLILAFNRADHIRASMKAVQQYKPDRLYLACDGPRTTKIGEEVAVDETRKEMLKMINWPCEVKKLFRKENLGCAKAVYGAISWFFEQEKWGIIIEDDVVISQNFFLLCEELLPKYAEDSRIMQITSQYYGNHQEHTNTYTFQKKPFIWGWATWRRSWQKNMDMTMAKWPNFKIKSLISYYGLFQSLMMYYYWNNVYKDIDKCTSWATRWHFAAVANDLICICPKTNLGINIGCQDGNGTHYKGHAQNPYDWLKIGELKFPLTHPLAIELDKEQLRIDNADFLRLRIIGLKHKFISLWKR